MPDLGARLATLIDCPSVSGDERAIAALVREAIDGRDAGDSCVLGGVTERGDRPLVLLAGHFDTVPAQGNAVARRENGIVHGLGASDMKGSLAVMIELALASPDGRKADLGVVFFPREELPFVDTALTPLLDRERGLRSADLVIVMEPTAGAVQLGCLGNINATWKFTGAAGHSARPWLADNAIERAAAGIAAIAAEPVEHDFGGLTFREVTSAVTIHGGIARNVIPATCAVELNHRYAPGTSAEDAEQALHERCDPHGTLTIDANAPSGAVPHDNPLVDHLLAITGTPAEPKQAWTPVAEFALAGVDAVNYGPGDPAYAHRVEERVPESALAAAYTAIETLLRA